MMEKKEKILQKIKKQVDKQGMDVVFGAFGDMKEYGKRRDDLSEKHLKIVENEEYNGIVERYIYPESGGSFLKFWGCNYIYKGESFERHITQIGLAKAVLARFPMILKKSFCPKVYIALLFLFNRKKFWHLLARFLSLVHHHSVAKLGISVRKLNKFEKEIRRAVRVVIDRKIDKDLKEIDFLSTGLNVSDKYEKFRAINFLMELIVATFHADDSYRYRPQDILSELNQSFLKSHPLAVLDEVERLSEILIDRERSPFMKQKWGTIKSYLRKLLIVSEDLRIFLADVLSEINLDKIRMDENDLFFCLLKRNYNFRGMLIEDRIELRDKMNRDSGRVKIGLKVEKKRA